MRQSLTYDQGKEVSRHADLAAQTGVTVYFCDPAKPMAMRTCENTNGLLESKDTVCADAGAAGLPCRSAASSMQQCVQFRKQDIGRDRLVEDSQALCVSLIDLLCIARVQNNW